MAKINKGIRGSREDKAFDAINITLVILVVLIVSYPLYFIIIASISDPKLVANGYVVFWPKGLTLQGYEKVFSNQAIWKGYLNSIINTLLGTTLNLVCTLPVAFALSRKEMPGHGIFMKLITFTMLFNGGLIPTYLTIKSYGIMNTRAAIILPFAINVYNLIVARTYMCTNIPEEIRQASLLDGCDTFGFFFRIVLPLSKPIIFVLLLIYAVQHWTSYFYALVYLRNRQLYPLQVVLRELLIQTQTAASMGGDATAVKQQELADMIKYGVIIVSSLPLLIMYPFVQKFFEKGMMIGAVKG